MEQSLLVQSYIQELRFLLDVTILRVNNLKDDEETQIVAKQLASASRLALKIAKLKVNSDCYTKY